MPWKEVKRTDDLFFPGGDPYFQLRTGGHGPRGFASLEPSAWRPVLMRQNGGDAVGDQRDVRVPAFYTNPGSELQDTAYCTALVKRSFIEALPDSTAISRITVLPPIDGETVPADPEPTPSLPALEGDPESGTVVVGVIDYGIAFAHERFRLTPETTRVEYLWVQDARVAPSDLISALSEGAARFDRTGSPAVSAISVPVNPIPYGRELAKMAIDGLLEKLATGALANEDELYRAVAAQDLGARWLRSIATRTAHATHVMDLACGYDLDEEHKQDRERRPIVAVQLAEATTEDTSGERLDAYAFDAIRYILDRADAIAWQRRCGPLPVVINFSYGNVAGPHDGSSDLEQAIDEVAEARRAVAPFQLVISSGNSHLARLHAEVRFASRDQKIPLSWRALPDDKTPSFLEIWLPHSDEPAASRINLTIATPEGEVSKALGEVDGAGLQLCSADEEVLCEARYRYIPGPPQQQGRGMFLIALQPTTPGEAAAPIAPSGIWTVELGNLSFPPRDLIEVWIQRDDTPVSFRQRGRQSFLDAECYRRFDSQGRPIERDEDQQECFVKRAGSTNAIATGKQVVVVGGFLRKEGRRAGYSALGDEGERPTPDYLAPSDDSLVHLGLRAAGSRSGSIVTLNGTSVAAPQVARWIADQTAKGPDDDGGAASVDPDTPAIGPDGWSDPAFAGAGIVPDRDGPTWPRPRPGAPEAEGVVYDERTNRPATHFPQAAPKAWV